MKRSALLLAALPAAFVLAGCSQTTTDNRQADAQSLKDYEAKWNQEYTKRDADLAVSHYTDDAVLMGPGMPASSGKDAIRKTLTGMLADPALSLQFQTERAEVARSGDVGYTRGTYTMTMTDPNTKQLIHDHGSYVTTYRKQADGSWKAVADIATSEAPPPAPAAPEGKKAH